MTTIEMAMIIRKSGKYSGLLCVPYANGAGWMIYTTAPEFVAKVDNKPKGKYNGQQVLTIKQAFKLCMGV